MIFIALESIMNGLREMDHIICGIEAESFNKAKDHLKDQLSKLDLKYEIYYDGEDYMSYEIFQKEDNPFTLKGIIKNKELEIFR